MIAHTDSMKIRNWAIAEGFSVTKTGKLPKTIIERYEAAHSDTAVEAEVTPVASRSAMLDLTSTLERALKGTPEPTNPQPVATVYVLNTTSGIEVIADDNVSVQHLDLTAADADGIINAIQQVRKLTNTRTRADVLRQLLNELQINLMGEWL